LQLQFPLAVGRQWRKVTDTLFKDNRSTARTTVDVRVIAHEKVRVIAGEFESTCWYAPSEQAIVKSTTTSTHRGTSHVELVDAAFRP